MKTTAHYLKSILAVFFVSILLLALAGCPGYEGPDEEKGKVTLLFSAGLDSSGEKTATIPLVEKATVVHIDEIESLLVTIEEIWVEQQTDDGPISVSIYNDAVEVDLIELVGVLEVIDSAEIPAGEFTGVTLALSNPTLVLSSAPDVVIENVQLFDDGILFVPIEFVVEPDGEGLLVLDLGGINLVELEDGSYRLVPDFQVDIVDTSVQAQAIGKIRDLDLESETFVLKKKRAELWVQFSEAVIFLPDDFDSPSGTPEDLVKNAKVFVFGTLGIDDVFAADVVVILEYPDDVGDDDDDDGHDSFKLKLRLYGTDLDPEAFGEGFYEAKHGRRRLLLEMVHITSASSIYITVDHQFVEDLYVRKHSARLNLDTRLGHEVPEICGDSLIEVRRAETGEVIMTSDWDGDHDRPRVKLDLRLYGTDLDPEALGEGYYKAENGHRRLLLEMAHITSASSIYITVDHEFLEDLPVVEGCARLYLKTQLGQWVPEITRDSLIEVRHAETGEVIMTSDWDNDHDRPCIKLDLRLYGTDVDPEALGEGYYKAENGHRRLLLEMAYITSAEAILVVIDDVLVEDLWVVEGSARLHLKTELGQWVPEMFEDSVVEIFNAYTEELILTTNPAV